MAKRPNILWLCSDQQRFDTIHALGNSYIDTPNLDRLCSNGVAFTNAYVQNPVCTPSRASFLSGKYPSSINSNILGAENNPEHCTLITKALANAGYHCGNIGKLHISAAWSGTEHRCDDGYAEFIYSLGSGHDLEHGHSEYANWLKSKGIDWHTLFTNNGENYYWYREDAPIELRQTAWCAERAIQFMRENRGKDAPWLLSVNCFDPHPPYDAPKELTDKYLAKHLPEPIFSEADYFDGEMLSQMKHQTKTATAPNDKIRRDKASYYGLCELVDRHYGRIVDALNELGIVNDTIVIFTSDHGEMLGDHGLELKGCRFYEGAVHVPLIFSCPSRFYSGKQVNGLAELTDIAPTIAELCGIDFPDTHGHSLMPHLQDCGREPFDRQFARCEFYASTEHSDEGTVPTYATMYRDKRYKLITYHGIEYGQLFDLESDQKEMHNLWNNDQYKDIKFELLKKSFDTSVLLQRPGQVRVGRY